MKKKNSSFFLNIAVSLSVLAVVAFIAVLFVWKLESAAEKDVIDAISLFRKSIYLMIAIPGALIILLFIQLKRQQKNRLKLQTAHRELSALYNTLPGGVMRCKNDDHWTVLFANSGFFRFLGYSKQEFSEIFHNQAVSIIHPDDYQKISANRSFLMTFGSAVADEYRVTCAGGIIKWVWLNVELVEDKAGKKSFYCTFTDITPIKETQEQLLVNQRLYEIVLDQTQDTIFEWNIPENTAYFSKNFFKKFGYEPCACNFPECVLQNENIHKNDLESFRKIGCQLLNGEKQTTGEFRIRKADGSYLWCSVSATAILDQNGKAYKAVGILSDIDVQRQVLQTAKEYAQKDSLTGLYNKGTTESRIRNYIEKETAPAALIIIDIDNFKKVNDTLGHLYGDAALKEIAHSVKSLFRSTDVVGRIGGDEFVVFLEQIADEAAVYKKAGKITEIFRHAFAQTNVNYKMTGSIGVAFYPKDADNYPELFDKADIALYFAKNHGKNQFAAYCEKVEEENVLRCGVGSRKY